MSTSITDRRRSNIVVTDRFLTGETPRYDGRFPVEPRDERVKVVREDNSDYLFNKFEEGSFDIVQTPTGDLKLRLNTETNLVFGQGLYYDQLGRVSLELGDIVGQSNPNLFLDTTGDEPKISLRISADGGIHGVPTKGLSIKLNPLAPLQTDGDGLMVFVNEDSGLSIEANQIQFNTNPTAPFSTDTDGLQLLLNTDSGLSVVSNELQFNLNPTSPFSVDVNGLQLEVDEDAALSIVGNELRFNVNGASPFTLSSSGLNLSVNENSGLSVVGNQLQFNIDDNNAFGISSSGLSLNVVSPISIGASGVQLNINSPLQIESGSLGVRRATAEEAKNGNINNAVLTPANTLSFMRVYSNVYHNTQDIDIFKSEHGIDEPLIVQVYERVTNGWMPIEFTLKILDDSKVWLGVSAPKELKIVIAGLNA